VSFLLDKFKGVRSADKWGLANTLLRVGSPLIFLPVLLRSLSAQELGVWYLVLSMYAFASTLEMGVAATISRAIGLLKGGALSLKQHGFVAGDQERPNIPWIERLIPTSRWMGMGVALVMVVAAIIMAPYLEKKFVSELGDIGIFQPLIIIAVFTLAGNILGGHAAGVVIGLNRQELVLKRTFIISVFQTLVGLAILIGGGKILGLATIYLGASILTWLWNEWSLHACCKEAGITPRRFYFDLPCFVALRPTWLRNSAVFLGGYFVMNSGILVSGFTLGLEETARWGLTMQAMTALNSFCQIGINSIVPEMSVLRGAGRDSELVDLFGRRLRFGLLVFLTGGVALILGGDLLLGLIDAKTTFLPAGYLIAVIIVQALEFNHSAHATVVLSANYNPFAVVSILGGGLVLLATDWMTRHFGVAGLISGRGLVQAMVVNWWPILLAAKSLSYCNLSDYVRKVYGIPPRIAPEG
jgi:O-antigen/teichoic acid export membrane protein